MSKESQPFYEKFRWELLTFYMGILIALIGSLVFSYYTAGWVVYLNSVEIWMLIGTIVMLGGLGVWGAASAFRQKTHKLMAGNKMFELAHPKPNEVNVDYFTIDPSYVEQNVPQTLREHLEAAKAILPGYDGTGQRVPTSIVGLGGIDAYGFKSLHPGSQGWLILHGTDQLIQTSHGAVCPYDLEVLDHTRVEGSILEFIGDSPNFIEGKTPFFVAGPISEGFHRWLQTSPAPQAIVLQSIGLNGLADRFLTHLNARFQAGHFKGMAPDGFLTPEAIRELREVFIDWLDKSNPRLKLAAGHGHAGAEYWRSKYFGVLSAYNYEAANNKLLQDANMNITRLYHRITGKEAALAGVAPTPGPTYLRAGATPNSPMEPSG